MRSYFRCSDAGGGDGVGSKMPRSGLSFTRGDPNELAANVHFCPWLKVHERKMTWIFFVQGRQQK
jgi:hypothetical protein